MKNNRSRTFGKLFGVLIIAALASFVGTGIYEDHQSDKAKEELAVLQVKLTEATISNDVVSIENFKTSIGEVASEAQHHSDNSGLFTYLIVCAFVLPAIHGPLKLTGTLGLHRPRYFVPELNQWLSLAGFNLWNYLMNNQEINSGVIADLKEGRLRMRSFTPSIKAIITSMTGSQTLFDGSVIQKQGRIPEILNGGKLPKSAIASLSHVRVGYCTDATATVPEADVDYTSVVTAWPAALVSGETVISQDIPRERFDNRYAGSQANGFQSAVESDGFEFDQPMILEPETIIKIDQKFAAGQSISGTNNHFITYDFIGCILARKY